MQLDLDPHGSRDRARTHVCIGEFFHVFLSRKFENQHGNSFFNLVHYKTEVQDFKSTLY